MGGSKNKAVSKPSSDKNSENKPSKADVARQSPNWPPFKPNLPVIQLVFDAPIPAFQDQIVLLHNFWPKSLCRDYLNFLARLPLTTTPGRPKRGEATRVNDRFQTDDPGFAQRLWLQTGLRDAVVDDSVKHLWYTYLALPQPYDLHKQFPT